jgi:fatty-acyl-CoA synthase
VADLAPDAGRVGNCGYVEVPTLAGLLSRACDRYGERDAITVEDTSLSFAGLHWRAVSIARGLSTLGVGRGTRVGLFMPNCLAFVEYMFAITSLGAVVVPINSRFRFRELAHVIADAELGLIVTTDIAADIAHHPRRLAEVLEGQPGGVRPAAVSAGRSDLDGFMGEEELLDLGDTVPTQVVADASARVRLRDTAAILYTSGTTAMPKGCVHTHEGLVRNGLAAGRTRFQLTTSDRFWDPLPMFHVGFLAPMIACLDAGTALLAMSHFDPERALDLIDHQRATWLYPAFQAVVQPLLDASSFTTRRLPHVRMVMCVGLPPLLRRIQAAFPQAELLSTYGSTETGGVITYHEPDATRDQRATTCGTPYRGVEIAIKDIASDQRLAAGQQGEILVRGFSVLEGYLNDPQATGAALDREGWLHTGDLGLVDGNGHVVYRGRLKEMIKVGGENVSCSEVEALLAEHPAVAVVHVVPAPDPRLEEVVAAFVQLGPGATATAEELIGFCRGQIASFKVPRYVRFVEEWPMSATKVRKADLATRIADEIAASQASTG